MKTVESTRRFITAWCKSKGITVVSEDRITVPAAVYDMNSKERWIYMPSITVTNHDEWQRFAYHESAHLMEDNLWHYHWMEKIPKSREVARLIANCLVDNLAERLEYSDYRGRAEVLSRARTQAIAGYKETFLAPELPRDKKLIAALLVFDGENREKWMAKFSNPLLPEHADAEVNWFLKKIRKLRVSEVLDYLTDNSDVAAAIELTYQIEALLKEEPPPPPEPPPQGEEQSGGEKGQGEGEGEEGKGQSQGEEGEGEGGGQGEEGEESEGEEGQGEGGSQGEEGEGEGEGGSQGQGEGQGEEESAAAAPVGEGGGQGKEGALKDENAVAAIFSEGIDAISPNLLKKTELQPTPETAAAEAMYIINGRYDFYLPHSLEVFTIRKLPPNLNRSSAEKLVDLAGHCTLSKQIRKYLQLKSHGREIHGVTRGKLSGKSLHRLYSSQSDTQPRVFRKKEHGVTKLDSAVSLLVDCSGSMRPRRMPLAQASALVLSEVLTGLKIPHEIAGFAEVSGANVGMGTKYKYLTAIYLWKEYEERAVSRKILSERMASQWNADGFNTDGEAVQWMAERLFAKPQQNKIQIVLSDGKPAGHYKGDGAWYLKQVVKEIEERSPIYLIGIGIQTSAVREFYSNYRVIDDIRELPEAILQVLKDRLIEHNHNQ